MLSRQRYLIHQTLAESTSISAHKSSCTIRLHCSPGMFSGLPSEECCHLLIAEFISQRSICAPHSFLACLIFIVFAPSILICCCRIAVRNEIAFAYLLQHDQCADTSLLKHEGSVVLQVSKLHNLNRIIQLVHVFMVHLNFTPPLRLRFYIA